MLPGEKRNRLPLMLRLRDLLLNGACSFLETVLGGYGSQAHRVLAGCPSPLQVLWDNIILCLLLLLPLSGGRGGSDGDTGTGIRSEALCF